MADAGPGAIVIRDPWPEDEETWRRLWAGYVDFYEAHVTEDVTAATWQHQLDPEANLFDRLAELDGTIVGFTVSVLHEGHLDVSARLLLGGSVCRSEAPRPRSRPRTD